MSDDAANGQRSGAEAGPGATLMAERRRQNMSLGDISRQLKLAVRQVEALERDDFSGFQNPVFVHGFIRNYARLLALDPNPLVRAADRILSPAPVAPETEIAAAVGARNAQRARISKWPAITGVAFAMLVAGMMYMGGRSDTASKPRTDPVESQVAARAGKAEKQVAHKQSERSATEKRSTEKPSEYQTEEKRVAEQYTGSERSSAAMPREAAPGREAASGPIVSAEAGEPGPRIVVRMIFEQESWVEIKDRNGNSIFGQLNAAGSRRSVSGEPPLTVVVGNATGVQLFQGDQSIDLAPHMRVDVARLTLE